MDNDLQKGLLLCMGNPLLDITAQTSTDFLEKYGMQADNAILAEERHLPIYEDMVKNYPVEYTAGGSAQNSARVVSWILGQPGVVTYMGSIGKDKFGETLEQKAKEAGVDTRYMYQEDVPTGTCAVVVTGFNRSLCANLSAANHFRVDHIRKPENSACIEKAQFIYMSSFFLTVSTETMLEVAEHACTHNKPVILNLSAPFLVTVFRENMDKVLPYVDIIMGNEMEALTFAQEHNFGTEDLRLIAQKLTELPKKNTKRKRLAIITQGTDPVLVAQDGEVSEFNVPRIDSSLIVDTNGAGDAFAGGFLSQYIQHRPIKTCVEGGIYVASEVIQRAGCTFPDKPHFRST